MKLGQVVFVPVAEGVQVTNMIGQHGIKAKDDGTPPIRYGALEECLITVAQWARDWDHASVHMPRIGCGLAGGKWSEIEPIILRRLVSLTRPSTPMSTTSTTRMMHGRFRGTSDLYNMSEGHRVFA